MAPFTVKCVSTYGELYKISNQEFEALFKKDEKTMKALCENYKEKQHLFGLKKQNMHVEMKFATADGPKK